jgi:DNA-binding transcriptional MerR regulator
MANYTIRDLEKLSGIKAHTIRIWEKRYGLIEPHRTSTNIRTYCDAELKKLLNVSILNRSGYKISKIAQLSNDEIAQTINQLNESEHETENQIENLAIAMIDLDENKFEKILARSIIQLGFEDTIIKILYPFFIRIGVMWQTGSINPAHEHFVSNLVRQKLLVAIDSQVADPSENSKIFTLFLPEGELHELGLLFFTYMIKKRGHQVIYLGQTVPIDDLKELCNIRSFDYLLTSFVASIPQQEIIEYVNNLKSMFPDKTVYVSGYQVSQINGAMPEPTKIIQSPLDLIAELNRISSL